MTGNQVVSTMFDFNTCNCTVRFVLTDDEIEDPGSHHLGPGYDGVFLIYIDTYIHFVCLVAMSQFQVCQHTDLQCILGGYVLF
jgi:hypothetical protein